MKKTFKNIRTLAALLMAGAAFAACSSDDNSIIEQQPVVNPSEQVYTLTLEATNSSATTRALNLDGSGKLSASWAEGDELTVVKSPWTYGTLSVKAGSVSDDGQSATFTGTVDNNINVGDELTLVYHRITDVSTFESQDGTLKGTNGAEKYDMATATVTVKTIETVDLFNRKITIEESEANFATNTSMIKLTLTDGTSLLNPTTLKVTVSIPYESGTINEDIMTFTIPATTYTTNGDGILYYALPSAETLAAELASKYYSSPYYLTSTKAKTALETATVTFTATVGNDAYTVDKTGYKFEDSKYYATTLTMAKSADLKQLNLTNPALGQIIGSDGINYDATTGDLPGGVEKVAVIVYVNGSNGLALALSDAGQMDWDDANTAATNATPKFSNGTWRVPTNQDWWYIFGKTGTVSTIQTQAPYSFKLYGYFSNAGGTFSIGVNYWSGTESGASDAWTLYTSGQSTIVSGTFQTKGRTTSHYARLCLAF